MKQHSYLQARYAFQLALQTIKRAYNPLESTATEDDKEADVATTIFIQAISEQLLSRASSPIFIDLSIFQALRHSNHFFAETAVIMLNLAHVNVSLSQCPTSDQALSFERTAFELLRMAYAVLSHLTDGHLEVCITAIVLKNILDILLRQGRYRDAQDVYRRLVGLRTPCCGDDDHEASLARSWLDLFGVDTKATMAGAA